MANRTINTFQVAGFTSFNDGVDVSISGGSLDTLIDSISVPGGTFKTNDILIFHAAILRSGTTSATLSCRIWWNTSPDLSGAVLLGISSGNVIDEYVPIMRKVAIVSNTNTLVYNTGIVFETDFGDSAGNETASAISTITSIDWTLDGFFIVSGQNNNSTTITKKYLYIQV